MDSLTELAVAARALLLTPDGPRRILGLAGAPGAGKSTLAARLVEELGPGAVVVPLDGFHLAQAALERLGLADRKGAPETFDAEGYLALLRRIRTSTGTVWCPAFDRDLEQPIAGSIAVTAEIRLIVTEGNYLALDEPPWRGVRALLDAQWWVEADDGRRVADLLARHRRHGRSAQQALEWVARVDEPNAARVRAGRHHADRVVHPTR